MCCLLTMVDLCCFHLNIFLSLIPWSSQLMDLSEVFLSTDIEFVKTALSQPEGSVQAICVPGGAVRTKQMCLISTFDHDFLLLIVTAVLCFATETVKWERFGSAETNSKDSVWPGRFRICRFSLSYFYHCGLFC